MIIEKPNRYKIGRLNEFKTEIGVLNNGNSKSTYIRLGAYAKPNSGLDFITELESVGKYIKHSIKQASNQLFDLDTTMPIIALIESSKSHCNVNRLRLNESYNYINIDVTLFFNDYVDINDVSFTDNCELLLMVINDMLVECPTLDFKPTKK